MNFLKKEIVTKKTVGMALIESMLSAVTYTIIAYVCFGTINDELQAMLQSVSSGQITALELALIMFPIFLIISLTITLGYAVYQANTPSNQKRKKKR